MDNTEIRIAEVRKTFNTTGAVTYICAFLACEGNWTVDRCESKHKSEDSAFSKLDKLVTKHGARLAPSFKPSARAHTPKLCPICKDGDCSTKSVLCGK